MLLFLHMKKINKKTKEFMYSSVPELISASDLQRKSGKIIHMLKDSTQPYFIVKNNRPTGVIMGISEYEKLRKIQASVELKEVSRIIKEGEKEFKEGRATELKGSVYDLWENLQNNEND